MTHLVAFDASALVVIVRTVDTDLVGPIRGLDPGSDPDDPDDSDDSDASR